MTIDAIFTADRGFARTTIIMKYLSSVLISNLG